MEDNILDTAQKLKDLIWENPAKGSEELILFVKRHANRPSLRQMAIMLKFEHQNAQQEDSRSAILMQMIDLVEDVLHLHNESKLKEEISQIEANGEIQAHYLSQKMTAQREIVCECDHINKSFRKGGFRLQDVQVSIESGKIVGVVGENANGKTTLFRILVGELKPEKGNLRYPALGQAEWNQLNWYKLKNQISYVPQDLPVWHGNLKDNLHYEAALHGLTGEANEDAVDYIIARLGLTPHVQKKWSQLSGGYKLRFALAKALVWKPKFLVIDEPLANLDIKSQVVFLSDLKSLAQSIRHPIAVMISSQHIHELESIVDQVVFMRQGQVLYQGESDKLKILSQENVFELSGDLSWQEIQDKLRNFEYIRMENAGLGRLIIRTPLHIGRKEILRAFLEQDIDIHYFRDISQSTKTLFYENS